MDRRNASVVREAAKHFLTLQDPATSAKALKASMLWIGRNDEHLAAAESLRRFWSLCDDIPRELPQDAADLMTDYGAAPPRRLHWAGWGAIAACLVACLVTGAAALWGGGLDIPWRNSQEPARYATAVGEVRAVNLSDGSVVTLSGASGVTVDFGKDVRRIALTDGQALFQVAHDPKRPFVVESGLGSIRAVGTEFDVHRSVDGATVTVLDGVVKVSTGGGPQRSAAVRAGMQVTLDTDGRLSPATIVDAAAEAQWRAGVLRFVDERLAVVIADLNRYSTKPVTLASQELADMKVTGLVRVEGISEWLTGMCHAIGASVDETEDRIILRQVQAPLRHASDA